MKLNNQTLINLLHLHPTGSYNRLRLQTKEFLIVQTNVKGNDEISHDLQFAHNLVGDIPFAYSRFSRDVTAAMLVYRTIEGVCGIRP